jgi:hypothetical protein
MGPRDNGTVTFVRQLVVTGRSPVFGPSKNDVPRTLDLAPETVAMLREHKRHQAELKMANRLAYQDLGLVFVQEWGHLHGSSGFARASHGSRTTSDNGSSHAF